MTSFEDALAFAAKAHKGQVDKSRTPRPYILHPMRVAMRVETAGDEAMQVGVLHDVIEDCGVVPADLREAGFSEDVIEAVVLLSRPPQGAPNRPTHAQYVQAIKDSGNRLAILVKFADLGDNMNRVDDLPPEQRSIRKRYDQGFRILAS
jgi:GTP diphosphokinase / guanosine-3',5'-bis(diphosphate) 3'-diphosphatase